MQTSVSTLAFVVAAVAAVRGLWSPCGLSMVSALNPMSERARGHRYGLTAAWYVAGAGVGGALLGLGGAVGALVVRALHPDATVVAAAALLVALVAWLSDSGRAGWSLPLHPRQVNEKWISTYRRWIYAAGFGAQIGTGFATYIMSAAVYLTCALAVLTGSATAAFAVGLAFGLLRGLGFLVGAAADSPERLHALHRWLERHAGSSLIACLAVEVAVVACAGWSLAGPALAGPLVAVLIGLSGPTALWTHART